MSTEQPLGVLSVVPDGFYTRNQAAGLVGRDRDTLRRWHRRDIFVPTHFMTNGKVKTWLYSEDDIKALKEIASTMKAGRPKKVTA